ncbi:MAG TPA: protein kinase [Vicinamibacterales bacterium]
MALTPNTRLGPYEITSQIGAGGMGEVYRARDSKLKRDVALKVLPADVAGDRERLARFQREAEVLASLNHPNIAHIHGLEESNGTIALVMELVDGEDLAQRLTRGAIPIEEALAIAKQIADALEAAHEQGIIHRDLKPANIKVRDDGTVKVLDFGLAKALEPGAGNRDQGAGHTLANSPTITSPAMTMRGVILGTAAYMSPEQAKGKPVDKRTDIWAFGCVLFEMITGRRAFDGEDVTDTIAAVVTREPDWSWLPAATTAGVRRLLSRCLVKDRKQRLRDIGDANHELADQGAAVMPSSRQPNSWRRWSLPVAAAAAVLLLAVPAARHLTETTSAPPPLRLTMDAPPNTARLLSPEISADGRMVAFSALAAGAIVPQLWIRRLEETSAQLAPGSVVPTGAPFWSPDGRALAVPNREGLLHLDLSTGGTRVLADLRSTMVGISQFSGSWGSQGVLIYGLNGTIYRVSENGGDASAVPIEGTQANTELRFPTFLPDGRRFVFVSREKGEFVLHAASIDGGPATRLFESDSQAIYTEPIPDQGYLVYVKDEQLMAQGFDATTLQRRGTPFIVAPNVPLYTAEFIGTGRGAFSVSKDGVLVYTSQPEAVLQRLVWMDRSGKEVGTIGDPAIYFSPRISPDGQRVAVARLDPRTRYGDIYILQDKESGRRLTFDDANDLQPVWTPDGEWIVWGSTRGPTSFLVRRRADGSGNEEILHQSPHNLAPDDVSPDGRYVVFRESNPVTRNDLWIVAVDRSSPAKPLLNTGADEPRARFSPDGTLIGYISDASGQVESYLQPFPDMNGKWQVTEGSGNMPQWRRDGREIYFASRDTLFARAVLGTNPLKLGPMIPLFKPPATPRGSFFHASADGQRFLFAPEQLSTGLQRYNVAVGWVKP